MVASPSGAHYTWLKSSAGLESLFFVALNVFLFVAVRFALIPPCHPFVDLTVGIMILAKVNSHRNFAAVHVTAVAIRAGRPYQRTQVPFLFL